MTDQVCKAAICEDEAQSKMMGGCAKVDSLKGGSLDLRIKCAGIYIKAMTLADKAVMKAVESEEQETRAQGKDGKDYFK